MRNKSSPLFRLALGVASVVAPAFVRADSNPTTQPTTQPANTLDLESGKIKYSFELVTLEKIEAGGREFFLLDRDKEKDVEVK